MSTFIPHHTDLTPMSTASLGETLRPQLGNFVSIVGFQALLNGLQEALGEKARP